MSMVTVVSSLCTLYGIVLSLSLSLVSEKLYGIVESYSVLVPIGDISLGEQYSDSLSVSGRTGVGDRTAVLVLIGDMG
jgi:hypothetical protein